MLNNDSINDNSNKNSDAVKTSGDKHGYEYVNLNGERVLLITLPFWSPLIPAQGIASLKSFLQQYGYKVMAVDATSENSFMELYNKYFEVLREIVPPNHRGNFFNIGHDVLRNHMMAHTNYTDEKEYYQLVRLLIYYTYYWKANDTQILELNNILDELFSRLKQFTLNLLKEVKPSVLGLSANSGNLASTRFVLELAKKEYPQLKTVMGGCVFFNHLAIGNPDLEFFLEKTSSYLDKVIMGKGEILLLKYLRAEVPQSQRVLTFQDLDEETLAAYKVGIPDLSDYNLEKYLYLAASASSSCPYKCSFCNTRTWFGEFHKKDPEQTTREMMELKKKYGHSLFFMTDALLNPVITNLANEVIRKELIIYMDGYFVVDKQGEDIENTLLWRRGGLYRVRLGTESGSQRVLDLIGKKITPKQIKEVVSNLAYAGIKTTTYWVVGHPGETEADFQQTLDLIEDLRDDIWQAECNPFTYFYVGQTNSEKWGDKKVLLYPEKARDMLISQTWTLDCEPSREETYQRVFRFVDHCNKLGIPNPYSFDEIFKADERWKKLHKNAVPSIMQLMKNNIEFDERKKVKKFLTLRNAVEEGDFGF